MDQLEEVYTYCQDSEQQENREKREQERDAFINNLLYAASDRSGSVAIIVTMRSDFLAATQQHPQLNRLFSDQGFLVPVMNEDELREAISEPAKQAGPPLDEAVVNLLVEQSRGREGTLPLLQFALTQIWNGIEIGKAPGETLREIGGVGGALAGEAQRIYDNLNNIQLGQAIARRVFRGLVQLGEGTKDTRRRVALETLKSHKDDSEQFQRVIDRFTDPGVRLITLSSDDTNKIVMAEVTHEALFEHWKLLGKWLAEKQDDLHFQRRLENSAQRWEQNQHPEGLLWRSPDLDLLTDFVQRSSDDMNDLQMKFFQAAQRAEMQRERQRRQQEIQKLFALSLFSVLIGVIALLFWQQIQAQKIIESVFIGTNTTEILKALPDRDKAAKELRQKVDKLQQSKDIDKSIEYYLQHKTEFNQLFAYYRNIVTATERIRRGNPQYEAQLKPMAERAEKSLAELLSKYRIPQLKSYLQKKQFGKYLEKPVTEFENQYSQGALRTTYEILMSNSGAGADLNKDGFIADEQEANQMPCQTLKEIEELWRKATDEHCGWYTPEGDYADDRDCKVLDKNRSTLYQSIFDYNTNHALDRIKYCGIQPH